MRHGSLFSGIGGFDLASEWMGWENLFNCEIDEFCQKVLKYHFPKAKSYDDITKTDFKEWKGKIDILTGGFPCQPFSVAGQRKGTEDNRHLWPEMLRAIREIKPRWVVGENVPGIINWSEGLVFQQVCTDLENEGYEVQPVILPAASVNAPHQRYRVWFVAHCSGERCNHGGDHRQERQICNNENRYAKEDKSKRNRWKYRVSETRKVRNASNAESEQSEWTKLDEQSQTGKLEQRELRGSDSETAASYSDGIGQSCKEHRIKESRRITEKSKINDWQNFPTQSPICNGDDGLSSRLDSITFPKWRNESIKAGGNAIVPQVALQIFKTIEDYETTH